MTQLNPAQQAAVDYNGDAMNLLVVAGAGCGKTRTIISRAARLIQQGPISRCFHLPLQPPIQPEDTA
jgi:superfamily I DNA/RNA helicase